MKLKMFWKKLSDDLDVLASAWKKNMTPVVFLEQAAENNLEFQVPLSWGWWPEQYGCEIL